MSSVLSTNQIKYILARLAVSSTINILVYLVVTETTWVMKGKILEGAGPGRVGGQHSNMPGWIPGIPSNV